MTPTDLEPTPIQRKIENTVTNGLGYCTDTVLARSLRELTLTEDNLHHLLFMLELRAPSVSLQSKDQQEVLKDESPLEDVYTLRDFYGTGLP